MLARLYYRETICSDATFNCLRCNTTSLKKEEHSKARQAKGGPVSTFSSLSQDRADRFTKHLPLRTACTTRVRAVTNFEKKPFAQWTYVVRRHRLEVKLQSMRGVAPRTRRASHPRARGVFQWKQGKGTTSHTHTPHPITHQNGGGQQRAHDVSFEKSRIPLSASPMWRLKSDSRTRLSSH